MIKRLKEDYVSYTPREQKAVEVFSNNSETFNLLLTICNKHNCKIDIRHIWDDALNIISPAGNSFCYTIHGYVFNLSNYFHNYILHTVDEIGEQIQTLDNGVKSIHDFYECMKEISDKIDYNDLKYLFADLQGIANNNDIDV